MTDIDQNNVANTSYVSRQTKLNNHMSIYGEAGRAVVARLLNFEVALLSIDDKIVETDPSALLEGLASGHRNQMTNFDFYICPIVKNQHSLSKPDKDRVIAYCSLMMAGIFCD